MPQVGLETLVRVNSGKTVSVMSLLASRELGLSAKEWNEVLDALEAKGSYEGNAGGEDFAVELAQ